MKALRKMIVTEPSRTARPTAQTIFRSIGDYRRKESMETSHKVAIVLVVEDEALLRMMAVHIEISAALRRMAV
jgi:hypothetical protein